jgi:hypothetical protein
MTAASGIAALCDALVPPCRAGCGAPGNWSRVGCRDASDPIVRRIEALVLNVAGWHEE